MIEYRSPLARASQSADEVDTEYSPTNARRQIWISLLVLYCTVRVEEQVGGRLREPTIGRGVGNAVYIYVGNAVYIYVYIHVDA